MKSLDKIFLTFAVSFLLAIIVAIGYGFYINNQSTNAMKHCEGTLMFDKQRGPACFIEERK